MNCVLLACLEAENLSKNMTFEFWRFNYCNEVNLLLDSIERKG